MTSAQELLSKYIQNTERVLAEITLSRATVNVDREKINSVVNTARRYLKDAKYYQDRKEFETGLASVAYSEGLLDALRLLEAAEFSWR